MGPKGALRAFQAAERGLQREAQRRHRELARLEKERAKLSAIEQARLEVETYENQLELLLSIHKEPCQQWDWANLAAALPAPIPKNYSDREMRARQLALVTPPSAQHDHKSVIEQARALDEQAFQEATATHSSETAAMETLRELALRVLAGESMALLEAFAELNPVAEFSSVGSLKQFAVVSKDLIECVFKANVSEVIPSHVKTLTTSGKVSIKPMPRSQFHELHQDYLCGCVIRMAREVFAMLPVTTLLVTAQADVIDPVTGQSSEQPVLSVAMPREIVTALDFDKVSVADAIDRFLHRGDFRASRKTGAFRPINPLSPVDLRHAPVNELDVHDLDASIRALREAIRSDTPAGKIATDRSAV